MIVSPLAAAVEMVTVPTVRLRVPKSRAPPPMARGPLVAPRVPEPASAKVPPLMVVPPM